MPNVDDRLPDPKMRMPRTDAAMNKVDRRKKNAAVIDRAMKRFDRAIQAESENRKAALDDRKFKAGDQWPADVQAQRNFDKRPCLTINKLPTLVHQITNDLRQNRPAINVSPVGDKGDPEVAKMYRGLIRAIERDSAAEIAYDTAADDACTSGFGYWRILTDYEAPDRFDQTIIIRRIRNPFSVYLDPDHQEPDAADIRWAFVSEMIPRSDFEAEYPDADPIPWTLSGIGESLKNWVAQDTVRISEYFELTHKTRTLVKLSNGHEGWEDELGDDAIGLIEGGKIDILQKREAEVPTITWYKLTAKNVLDEREWPGRWIPIVKVIGDEIDVEGKVKYSGVVRHAKDPQRMYNYWRTAETELIALAPKAPYLMAEGQVEGYEAMWKQANVKSYPYLLYKPTDVAGHPVPPPQRQPASPAPQGIEIAAQGAAQDMMATTGVRFDASAQERMIDESGKAIRELRRSGDIGSFHYVDNLARSLRHTGRILIDLIPKVYDTKRVITILREDDNEEQVQIDPHLPRPTADIRSAVTQKVMKVFNPTYGRYGVTVTIGPSYATKRIEAAESMMDFVRALPNTAALIADLIAKNQDWPGAEEIATRLAKALPPQLLAPEQKDMSPQVQAMLHAMDAQIKQLTIEHQKALAALNDKQADRAQQQDKIDKDFEAKLLAIVQKAEAGYQQHVGSQLKDLAEGVQKLHAHLTAPPAVHHGGLPASTTGQPRTSAEQIAG